MLLNCGVGEDSWESLGLQGYSTSELQKKSVLNIHWEDWCWSWNSNTLATWCKELTHLKRLILGKTEGGRRRGWQRMRWLDGITDSMGMSWVSSGSWWWTWKPSVLQSMESHWIRHNWATELNWTLYWNSHCVHPFFSQVQWASLWSLPWTLLGTLLIFASFIFFLGIILFFCWEYIPLSPNFA